MSAHTRCNGLVTGVGFLLLVVASVIAQPWTLPLVIGGMAIMAWGVVCEERCRSGRTCVTLCNSQAGSRDARRNRSRVMLTAIVIVLLVLAILNGSGRLGESQNLLWTILVVLLIAWLLVALGFVGDYGYISHRHY